MVHDFVAAAFPWVTLGLFVAVAMAFFANKQPE